MRKKAWFLFLLLSVWTSPCLAQVQADGFRAWLDAFAVEAQAQGVSPATLGRVLPALELDETVIELDRKQPESRISFASYLHNVMPPSRVEKARRVKDDYAQALSGIVSQTGVPASVIVALWGMESSFGTNTGDYRVLDSLATLAFEGRRSTLFRKEFIEALKILDEEGVEAEALQGSWAGAMGQCQFMPSTFRRFAVDYDGDGRRDIWSSDYDTMASIAHYLRAEGWKAGESWGMEVRLTRSLPQAQTGLDARHDAAVWNQRGVRTLSGKPLKNNGLSGSLVLPDGTGGRAFLVYDNFRALMRWNRSTYFAASVGLLADKIDGDS